MKYTIALGLVFAAIVSIETCFLLAAGCIGAALMVTL